MSVITIVTKPAGSVAGRSSSRPSERSERSWPEMNPIGTILYRLAAFSSRRRA